MQFSTERLLRKTEKGNPASLFKMQMGSTVCQHVTLSRQSVMSKTLQKAYISPWALVCCSEILPNLTRSHNQTLQDVSKAF